MMCIFPSATNCAEVQNRGFRKSGVYFLHTGTRTLKVFCDLSTGGGGWMVSNLAGINDKHGDLKWVCVCVCACVCICAYVLVCVCKQINRWLTP